MSREGELRKERRKRKVRNEEYRGGRKEEREKDVG